MQCNELHCATGTSEGEQQTVRVQAIDVDLGVERDRRFPLLLLREKQRAAVVCESIPRQADACEPQCSVPMGQAVIASRFEESSGCSSKGICSSFHGLNGTTWKAHRIASITV